ncbi:MAG: hypothetical protein LKJ80_03080, partial [Oscillibacter sp.]|nr:hypothetical protein [Oscillibacter sp.]
ISRYAAFTAPCACAVKFYSSAPPRKAAACANISRYAANIAQKPTEHKPERWMEKRPAHL